MNARLTTGSSGWALYGTQARQIEPRHRPASRFSINQIEEKKNEKIQFDNFNRHARHGAFYAAQFGPVCHPEADPEQTGGISRFPHSCADDMGHMRRVYQADIAGIESWQQVVLIPVCDDQTMASRTSYGSLFVEGNVGRLRMPIARNSTLMSALRDKDYDQYDVVSLGFGANDAVLLYVHQRDMR
ncbi:hypothetical protein PSQ90_02980 [Devosia rhodophyticola]|uniref:Uncharacterized protein n=1 Tax=Devosia rhodophyticola TaxID=3026423 RepID=A0ABY7YZE8_9HYPH|nr:hypothetical protein [Devosia rhodophyticola]WDR06448.1 hypothetical protein PSQ90_02980 [Devosia rhodophyticola]